MLLFFCTLDYYNHYPHYDHGVEGPTERRGKVHYLSELY